MATASVVIVPAGAAEMAPRPPPLGRAPAKPWRASTHACSSAHGAGRPLGAVDENLAVGRHAGLREADGAAQAELHADDLLDAIVPEVGVLRRERGLRIDAHHVRLDRL